MDSLFVYNGEDISFDVLTKMEAVVELIAQRDGMEFDECYSAFSASRTFTALQNPNSLMWAESAPFILDEYDRELNRE